MLISRAEWGAEAPKWPSAPWQPGQPTSATLHYEGSDIPADRDRAYYDQICRNIQYYHMHVSPEGYNDIAYNFVVSPIGDVYEGHGWQTHSAAQGDPGNALSLAICYMGGPDDDLTDAGKRGIRSVLNIMPGAVVYPHSHWVPTSCPGASVNEWIAQGCPAPTSPAPSPDPVKDDDMPIILRVTGTPPKTILVTEDEVYEVDPLTTANVVVSPDQWEFIKNDIRAKFVQKVTGTL